MDIQGYRGISGRGWAEGCEQAMASTEAADAAEAAEAAAWW